MNRPHKTVSVDSRDADFLVLLDGAPAATPRKKPLALPTRGLAEAIADEWRGKSKRSEVGPFTRLANTAIDRPRADALSGAMKYVHTDLLFYRAEEEPLARRQREQWDPVLDWARARYKAEFAQVTGIAPIEQPPETAAALRRAVNEYSDFVLTGLHGAAMLTTSLVLSLALAERRIEATEAFALSQLDERYQAERWGSDRAAEERADVLAQELQHIGRFFALLRP